MNSIFVFWFFALFLFSFPFSSAEADDAPVDVQQILKATLEDPQFNKTYLRDGCYLRAHWIAIKMNESNLNPLKVFIEPENKDKKINVSFPNGQSFSWVFHVAAAFKGPVSEKIWVLDPVLSSQVISFEDWEQIFVQQNPDLKLTTRVVGAEVYHVHKDAISDWKMISEKGVFSEEVIEFIRDEMSVLFEWEKSGL